ncbi:hypothetical protein [Kutzneria sp. 744]|uniref:hypothetical protein n=1 Tax=Kutzneria sp. (strain 744) TaxID=345341 RepID=UPI0004AD9894|nr:hypothetical protein [Kutzneria sp. 744]
MIRLPGLVLLALNIGLIAVLVVHALRRKFDDSDRGVGNVVRLPKPTRRRCGGSPRSWCSASAAAWHSTASAPRICPPRTVG